MGNSAAPTPDFSKAIPITGNGATPDFGNAIPVSGLPPADNALPKSSILDLITPAASPQAPAGHSLDVVKGIAQGAVTGMQDTLSGLSKVPGASALALPVGLFKSTVSPEDLAKEREAFAPKSKAQEGGQTLGGVGEGLLEFILGDEALKGVGLADKLGIASKLAKFSQENPYLGKLIDHLFTAGRQGLVAGTEETTKTVDVSKGLAAGSGVALGSAALGAAGETMGKARSLITEASAAPAAVREAAGGVAGKEGVTPAPSQSIRQTMSNLSDAIQNKATSLYKQLDATVGGENFQKFDKRAQEIVKLMRKATTDEAYDKLADDLDTARNEHLQNIEQATKSGLGQDTLDQANKLYAQQVKLEKLSKQVQFSTKNKTGVTSSPEKMDPRQLTDRIVKMHDNGELQTALGGDTEAAKLVYDVSKSADAQTVLKVLKWVIGSSGIITPIGIELAHRAGTKPTE